MNKPIKCARTACNNTRNIVCRHRFDGRMYCPSCAKKINETAPDCIKMPSEKDKIALAAKKFTEDLPLFRMGVFKLRGGERYRCAPPELMLRLSLFHASYVHLGHRTYNRCVPKQNHICVYGLLACHQRQPSKPVRQSSRGRFALSESMKNSPKKGHKANPKAAKTLTANEQLRVKEAESAMGMPENIAIDAVKLAESEGILQPDGALQPA